MLTCRYTGAITRILCSQILSRTQCCNTTSRKMADSSYFGLLMSSTHHWKCLRCICRSLKQSTTGGAGGAGSIIFASWGSSVSHPLLSLTGVADSYVAMVNYLDDSIGAVVDALESRGLMESTLITFSSDNGGPGTTHIVSHYTFWLFKDISGSNVLTFECMCAVLHTLQRAQCKVYGNGTSGANNWPLRTLSYAAWTPSQLASSLRLQCKNDCRPCHLITTGVDTTKSAN